MATLNIRCHLQQILLERENGFTLRIATFKLPVRGDGALNRIPLMGISGAGKSTLLNIMAAIEWPHQGAVSWSFPDGVTITWSHDGPTSSETRRLRREYFGYAFQDSTLMEHLRIGENLSYPLLLKGYSVEQAHECARQALKRVLLDTETVNLDEFLTRFPAQLSGGQRQRVALVQAMIHDPYVLFADEPTGSLDWETRRQVMDVLYAWVDDPAHRGQRLLLWVTHHQHDPQDAQVQQFLHINAGQEPQWRHLES